MLLPDRKGTDISWRGRPQGFPAGAFSSVFVMGNPGGVTKPTLLGAYSPQGLFFEFTLQPNL